MSHIYSSAAQLIGRTPMLELTNIQRRDGLKARILVKLEGQNPAGSVKDRVALAMIDDAEAKGLLIPASVFAAWPPPGAIGASSACRKP